MIPKKQLTQEEQLICWKRDTIQDYDYWRVNVPFLKFPAEWEISITPPFATAMVRFRVRHDNCEVSVYLDCHDTLGSVGEPYWEIYPSADDDIERFLLNNTDGLLDGIQRSLTQQHEKNQ